MRMALVICRVLWTVRRRRRMSRSAAILLRGPGLASGLEVLGEIVERRRQLLLGVLAELTRLADRPQHVGVLGAHERQHLALVPAPLRERGLAGPRRSEEH